MSDRVSHERLLRMPDGSYASKDGRFYAQREEQQWRVIDALPVPNISNVQATLADCRAWMRARRRIKT